MNVQELSLPGVTLFTPQRFRDERGYFEEVWHQDRYALEGGSLPQAFVQDNVSFSKQGVLRGLHFQHPSSQGKLVSILQGRVYDVVVDVRRSAPTFGAWLSVTLSHEAGQQLYIPEGYAHGFLVTSPSALFHYKCTAFYAPESERSIRWDDPEVGIEWPISDPVLSDKDAEAPYLRDLPSEALPD